MTHPSTVADTLDAAADLLSKPGAWTQGAEAKNVRGDRLLGDEPGAVCWCLIGALRHIGGVRAQNQARPALQAVIRGKPWHWNDCQKRTQDEVVAKLREAAAKARGEVQP